MQASGKECSLKSRDRDVSLANVGNCEGPSSPRPPRRGCPYLPHTNMRIPDKPGCASFRAATSSQACSVLCECASGFSSLEECMHDKCSQHSDCILIKDVVKMSYASWLREFSPESYSVMRRAQPPASRNILHIVTKRQASTGIVRHVATK